ncbi:hypothetical protein HDU76_006986, partial [Blyttiomyces sp. JEL0837]
MSLMVGGPLQLHPREGQEEGPESGKQLEAGQTGAEAATASGGSFQSLAAAVSTTMMLTSNTSTLPAIAPTKILHNADTTSSDKSGKGMLGLAVPGGTMTMVASPMAAEDDFLVPGSSSQHMITDDIGVQQPSESIAAALQNAVSSESSLRRYKLQNSSSYSRSSMTSQQSSHSHPHQHPHHHNHYQQPRRRTGSKVTTSDSFSNNYSTTTSNTNDTHDNSTSSHSNQHNTIPPSNTHNNNMNNNPTSIPPSILPSPTSLPSSTGATTTRKTSSTATTAPIRPFHTQSIAYSVAASSSSSSTETATAATIRFCDSPEMDLYSGYIGGKSGFSGYSGGHQQTTTDGSKSNSMAVSGQSTSTGRQYQQSSQSQSQSQSASMTNASLGSSQGTVTGKPVVGGISTTSNGFQQQVSATNSVSSSGDVHMQNANQSDSSGGVGGNSVTSVTGKDGMPGTAVVAQPIHQQKPLQQQPPSQPPQSQSSYPQHVIDEARAMASLAAAVTLRLVGRRWRLVMEQKARSVSSSSRSDSSTIASNSLGLGMGGGLGSVSGNMGGMGFSMGMGGFMSPSAMSMASMPSASGMSTSSSRLSWNSDTGSLNSGHGGQTGGGGQGQGQQTPLQQASMRMPMMGPGLGYFTTTASSQTNSGMMSGSTLSMAQAQQSGFGQAAMMTLQGSQQQQQQQQQQQMHQGQVQGGWNLEGRRKSAGDPRLSLLSGIGVGAAMGSTGSAPASVDNFASTSSSIHPHIPLPTQSMLIAPGSDLSDQQQHHQNQQHHQLLAAKALMMQNRPAPSISETTGSYESTMVGSNGSSYGMSMFGLGKMPSAYPIPPSISISRIPDGGLNGGMATAMGAPGYGMMGSFSKSPSSNALGIISPSTSPGGSGGGSLMGSGGGIGGGGGVAAALPAGYLAHYTARLTRLVTLTLLKTPTPPQVVPLALQYVHRLVSLPALPSSLATPTRLLLVALTLADSMLSDQPVPGRVWEQIARVSGMKEGEGAPTTTGTANANANANGGEKNAVGDSSANGESGSETKNGVAEGSVVNNRPPTLVSSLKREALQALDFNVHVSLPVYGSWFDALKTFAEEMDTQKKVQAMQQALQTQL